MPPHPNQVRFSEGVRLILNGWTALKLAVEMDWSEDGLAAEKFDWLVDEVIVDYFGKKGKTIDADEMDEILDQIMKDEFNTILEDDSSYHVGKKIVELYTQITHNDLSGLEALRAQAAQASSSTQQSVSATVPGMDIGSEDDDSEEDDE